LRDHIIEERQYEKDQIILKIYQDMLADIEVMKSNGAELVLTDGQNRLKQAIKPFFEGTMSSNDYDKPFIFVIDGKEVYLNKFCYTELDEELKRCFRETQVILAKGTAGDIKSFVKSVVDLNNGEPWSLFEAAIIQPTTLTYYINRDIFRDPLIQSLFGSDTMSGIVQSMSGNYLIEKKGDARYIAELTYMTMNRGVSGIGTEDSICSMIMSNDAESVKAYNKVKQYLSFISNALDSLNNINLKDKQKPLDRDCLIGVVLMLDIIFNKDNAGYHNCLLKMKKLSDMQTPKTIIENFIKWHRKMNDKHANPDDFEKGVAKPDTYAFNVKGTQSKNIQFRVKFITDYINNNCQEWVNKSYVIDTSFDYQKAKTALLEKADYLDIYKKTNNEITLNASVSIDHVMAKKGERRGTDKIDNLVATNLVSNSMKSNRY
jgi:hypothetical protein